MQTIKEFNGEYRWLSNFWPCPIYIDNIIYPSSEAAFQAYKTLDLKERIKFTEMGPAEAKKAGKLLKLREDWEEVKVSIMYRVLLCKFSQNLDLYRKLVKIPFKTKFEEGNYWGDKFWGICLKTGIGYNVLGQLLEEVHQVIQETERLRSVHYVNEYYL